MNNQARFSGRQKKMASLLSPAKAGLEILLGTLPRAALRFTSFRCACPGLNSAAGSAGSLNAFSRRRTHPILFLFLASLFLAACKTGSNVPSAATPSPNVRSSADVVKVSATNVSLPAGGNADATVIISITQGYHVNANPATFSYLIPTEVTVHKREGLSANKPVYPTAEKKKFQFAESPLAVYEGEAQIKLPLRAEANAARGARSFPIDVRVQACDQEKCFAPDTLHVSLAVEVR